MFIFPFICSCSIEDGDRSKGQGGRSPALGDEAVLVYLRSLLWFIGATTVWNSAMVCSATTVFISTAVLSGAAAQDFLSNRTKIYRDTLNCRLTFAAASKMIDQRRLSDVHGHGDWVCLRRRFPYGNGECS
jgi:hypothetical protein